MSMQEQSRKIKIAIADALITKEKLRYRSTFVDEIHALGFANEGYWTNMCLLWHRKLMVIRFTKLHTYVVFKQFEKYRLAIFHNSLYDEISVKENSVIYNILSHSIRYNYTKVKNCFLFFDNIITTEMYPDGSLLNNFGNNTVQLPDVVNSYQNVDTKNSKFNYVGENVTDKPELSSKQDEEEIDEYIIFADIIRQIDY